MTAWDSTAIVVGLTPRDISFPGLVWCDTDADLWDFTVRAAASDGGAMKPEEH